MKVIDIIYHRYMDSTGKKMTIGGIQTYITNLADLAVRLGYMVRIFQFADTNFSIERSNGIIINGVSVGKKHDTDKLISYVLNHQDKKNNQYLMIFANVDNMMPTIKIPHSICIQHGVGWDRISHNSFPLWLRIIAKSWFAYKLIRSLQNVDEVICVDNNFINWYRTLDSHRIAQLSPIMNFTQIEPFKERTENDFISIVFARRFFEYRGTRLFAAVTKRLIKEIPSIQVTFAGEGPDEQYLKDTFKDIPNVIFTQYDAQNSIHFHQHYDIAVVPTTGSEGTSLSLLEAMSASCATICTNVGGMTNIIINGYNGLMVNPNIEELYEALKIVIKDKQLRESIAKKGHETVTKAFSLSKWENEWTTILTKHFNYYD